MNEVFLSERETGKYRLKYEKTRGQNVFVRLSDRETVIKVFLSVPDRKTVINVLLSMSDRETVIEVFCQCQTGKQ